MYTIHSAHVDLCCFEGRNELERMGKSVLSSAGHRCTGDAQDVRAARRSRAPLRVACTDSHLGGGVCDSAASVAAAVVVLDRPRRP